MSFSVGVHKRTSKRAQCASCLQVRNADVEVFGEVGVPDQSNIRYEESTQVSCVFRIHNTHDTILLLFLYYLQAQFLAD